MADNAGLSSALDGIPMVADAAAREARFPLATRKQNQRVFRLDTGVQERWSGSAWLTDLGGPAIDARAFGVAADGSDQTVNLQAAITAANGRPVILPVGTVLFSSIANVPGRPLILWGQGADVSGTTLQTTAAASVAILIDQTANANFHNFRDFTLAGTATNTGGIKFGTATYRSAFVRLRDVCVINFSGAGAYGVRLDSVQEFDAENVYLQGNYNNLYRPALGFCTSASFHGPAGYNGTAVNVGFLADPFVGIAPLGITFRDKYVFESTTNEAIKATGVWAEIAIQDAYLEDCATGAGDIVTLSGTVAHPMAVVIQGTHFDAKGRAGAKNLSLDYTAAGSRIVGNPGLMRSGTVGADIVTTANAIAHFEDNGFGADAVPIYQALLGHVTFSETDPTSFLRSTATQQVRGRLITGQINPLNEGTLTTGTDVSLGNSAVVTLTGARLVAAPVNAKTGQRFVWTFVQGGAGGFAVTWNAVFKVSWSDTGNTVGKRSSIAFIYDGTSWNQDGAQAPYV